MISVISSFSDSTTGENTTTGYVKRLFVTFCDMSQKAIEITGYGPRPCGVLVLACGRLVCHNSFLYLLNKTRYRIKQLYPKSHIHHCRLVYSSRLVYPNRLVRRDWFLATNAFCRQTCESKHYTSLQRCRLVYAPGRLVVRRVDPVGELID